MPLATPWPAARPSSDNGLKKHLFRICEFEAAPPLLTVLVFNSTHRIRSMLVLLIQVAISVCALALAIVVLEVAVFVAGGKGPRDSH